MHTTYTYKNVSVYIYKLCDFYREDVKPTIANSMMRRRDVIGELFVALARKLHVVLALQYLYFTQPPCPPPPSSLHPPWSHSRPGALCAPSGAARGLRVRDIPARRPGLRTDSCSKEGDSARHGEGAGDCWTLK